MGSVSVGLDWGHEFGPQPKASWLLRLPVIRHVRAAWHAYRLQAWVLATGSLIPHPYDADVVERIWRGEC